MKTKLAVMLLTFTGLIILAHQAFGGNSAALVDGYVNNDYKGGSSFNFVGAGPNVARCGAFPENVELSFEGSGIDTEGGYNTAVFSACTNTTTNLVFDLKRPIRTCRPAIRFSSKAILSCWRLTRTSAPLRTLTPSSSGSPAGRAATLGRRATDISTSPAT